MKRECARSNSNKFCVTHKYSVSAQVSAQAQNATRLHCFVSLTNTTNSTTTSFLVTRATRIVLCERHGHRRTSTIGAIKFRILKITNLFDFTSFVYFKKSCSIWFWEILFSQNPEPRTQKSRTEKIMTTDKSASDAFSEADIYSYVTDNVTDTLSTCQRCR
jgi:hypothetical protein